MKKSILLTAMLIASAGVSAQKKEAIYKKLAEKSCDCSMKKGAPNIGEVELGLCLLEAVNTLDAKEQKIMGINPNKKMESIEKLAEGIGVEMALTCPQVFQNMKDDNGEALFQNGDAASLTNSGVVEDIISNEFRIIRIKDESGASQEFIWLTQFESDSLLLKGKVVKGDKVEVAFTEQQFYDLKSNAYRAYKVIKAIKLL